MPANTPAHETATASSSQSQRATKDKRRASNSKQSSPPEDQPQYTSRFFCSLTTHNAGQPVVHVSRSSFLDESGTRSLTHERRIGNKRAVSTWEESCDHDAITNAKRPRKTTYEQTEAAEFEAEWENLHKQHHALEDGSHDHHSAGSNAKDSQLAIANSEETVPNPETKGDNSEVPPRVVFSGTESEPAAETEQLPVLSSQGRPETTPAHSQPSRAVTTQAQTAQHDEQHHHHNIHWDDWMGPPNLTHFSEVFDALDHPFGYMSPWWANTPGNAGRERRRWHPAQAFLTPELAFDPWSFPSSAF